MHFMPSALDGQRRAAADATSTPSVVGTRRREGERIPYNSTDGLGRSTVFGEAGGCSGKKYPMVLRPR